MADALDDAVKLMDDKAAFEREFPEAGPYWNDCDGYMHPYLYAWRAYRAGLRDARGVKTSGEGQQ